MIDDRTRYFLLGALSATSVNYDSIDAFLLRGPLWLSNRNKPTLKVAFCDFWPDFDASNNIFTSILSGRFDITIDQENPDLVIYSVFGERNKSIKCLKKIFYTGENKRPPFDECDLAISFDYSEDQRHFRMPLYALHLYEYVRLGVIQNYCHLLKPREVPTRQEFDSKRFCTFIYSHSGCERRNAFFHKLHAAKAVDSYGRAFNNTGAVVKPGFANKISFISNFKFTFSFENSSHPGYVTEKIIDPLVARSIPLYWGSEKVGSEININSFINTNDLDDDEAIRKIIKVGDNYNEYCEYIFAKPMENVLEFYLDVFRIAEWIERMI